MFVDALVRCSHLAYNTLENSNFLSAEMVCLLLERMELSKGFINFEKRTFKPHISRTSLIPSKQMIRDIAETKISQMNPDEASQY